MRNSTYAAPSPPIHTRTRHTYIHTHDTHTNTHTKKALLRAIAPYDRVALSHLAQELNGVPEPDVEALLVSLILDGAVHGYIDQARPS